MLPSRNVTIPLGVPVLPDAGVIVAVRVTLPAGLMELAEELSAVVVPN